MTARLLGALAALNPGAGLAARGATTYGICSTPFLEYAFKTIEFRVSVTLNDDDSWSYEEDTVLLLKGQSEPFHHQDRNHLTRIGPAIPNPLARATG